MFIRSVQQSYMYHIEGQEYVIICRAGVRDG